MKKGPQPKHPSVRQRRNSASSLTVLPGGKPAEIPPMPTPARGQKMLAKTRDAWNEFWTSELAATVSGTDLPAIRRLFLLQDRWERYSRTVFDQPLVMGSKEQLVENPLARAMDRIAPEIRQLEDRFGMSPASKAKLNVQFGDAVRSLDDLSRRVKSDDDDGLRIIDTSAVEDTGSS